MGLGFKVVPMQNLELHKQVFIASQMLGAAKDCLEIVGFPFRIARGLILIKLSYGP